jgi:uncharacterized protein YkwD
VPRTVVQALAFLLGLWIALSLSPLTVRAAPAEPGPPALTELEAELHEAVNATRAEHHLIPLKRHPALDAVARAHASDMARRNYLSHDNPEGANAVGRLHADGVEGFTLAAENIGRTDESPPNRRILESWLASPTHRVNLLTAAFNTTGLGIVRAPNGALIYTQVYVTYPR